MMQQLDDLMRRCREEDHAPTYRDLVELRAAAEDAQGEIRALRATEAGLVDRVKELEEGLADAAQSLCWLAFGECRNITDRPLLTALQVESSARALLEKKE